MRTPIIAFDWSAWRAEFAADHALYWGNLSRLNGLLVILNISMFFLTGLVTRGYYYTFFSLGCLAAVGFVTLIPTRFARDLRYYLLSLLLEVVGTYFLVVSISYWVRHGG